MRARGDDRGDDRRPLARRHAPWCRAARGRLRDPLPDVRPAPGAGRSSARVQRHRGLSLSATDDTAGERAVKAHLRESVGGRDTPRAMSKENVRRFTEATEAFNRFTETPEAF